MPFTPMPTDDPTSSRFHAQDTGESATGFDALTQPFDLDSSVDLLLADLAPDATAAERTAHRHATSTSGSGAGRAVLVVDRSPIARKFLIQRLHALGYEAHGAQDGEEALELVEQRAFALVFSEVVLAPRGGLDGLRLCQAIKQKPDHPSGVAPAVVMVTGLGGSSDRVRGALAGCDAYLTKPLVEATFIAMLSEVDPLFR